MGTSILRRHVIIDETTSAIMQDVSFCVHVKRAGGWIGNVQAEMRNSKEDIEEVRNLRADCFERYLVAR